MALQSSKRNQWKWPIVLPYDVYQQQVPPNHQKCCPIDIYVVLRMYYVKWLFLLAVSNKILLAHINSFHLMSLMNKKIEGIIDYLKKKSKFLKCNSKKIVKTKCNGLPSICK